MTTTNAIDDEGNDDEDHNDDKNQKTTTATTATTTTTTTKTNNDDISDHGFCRVAASPLPPRMPEMRRANNHSNAVTRGSKSRTK